MRRVIATELVSVDGVMESPEEWAFPYSNDEMEQANAAGMAASDAMLLGRVTYEALAAYWPNQPGGTSMVDYINSVPKFVVSTSSSGSRPRGHWATPPGRQVLVWRPFVPCSEPAV